MGRYKALARVYRTAFDKQLQSANRRARQKMAYYSKTYDIDLAPPLADPRGLSGSAKVAALRKLKKFSETPITPGARGAILDSATWKQFQKLRNKVNKRNESARIEYHNVPMTEKDDTIGTFNDVRYGPIGWDKFFKRNIVRMHPFGPLAPNSKKSTNFTSDKALQFAIDKMRDELSGDAQRERDRKTLATLDKMFAGTSVESLTDAVRSLSPSQRAVLFNLTNFMHNVGFKYSEDDEELSDRGQSQAEKILASVEKRIPRGDGEPTTRVEDVKDPSERKPVKQKRQPKHITRVEDVKQERDN